MTCSHSAEESNPLAAVFLPEFGTEVSWAMCRNPACVNFGLPYEGPPFSEKKSVSDGRYRINKKSATARCFACGMSFTVKSNLAIRPLARYFLGLSLPFADCPNQDCANHGYNVFEHFAENGKRSGTHRYRRLDDHRVACRRCKRKFRLGVSRHLGQTRASKKKAGEVIKGITSGPRHMSTAIEDTKLAIGSYYSRLLRTSARVRDWHSWRNARLLHPSFGNWKQPIRAYTDTVVVPLQRSGIGQRYKYLYIVITVVSINGSYYWLAAHTSFMPEPHCPDQTTILNELDTPWFLAKWSCLQGGFGSDPSDDVETMLSSLTDVGRHGYFGSAYYAELAHFLVVRKLLSRFPKIYFSMDCSHQLYSAALVAFASDIRSRRVEIALFQHEKEKKKDEEDDTLLEEQRVYTPIEWSKRQKERLDSEWRKWEKRFDKERQSDSSKKRSDESDGDRDARLYKKAFIGANTQGGGWAWLKHPPTSKQFKEPRTLWLTWSPQKQYEEHGRELLGKSALNPVDSAAGVLRSRVQGLRRSQTRHKPGKSFRDSYAFPQVVLSELHIALAWRNYGARIKAANKVPPARPMKLTRDKESLPNLLEKGWNFRLGIKQARRMSKWVIR